MTLTAIRRSMVGMDIRRTRIKSRRSGEPYFDRDDAPASSRIRGRSSARSAAYVERGMPRTRAAGAAAHASRRKSAVTI